MGEKKLEKLFVEYLLPCDKEKKEDLIKKATIIIDTNVLLNCYRWSRETAEQFLNLLEQLSDRIWFSYYVLKEFFNKRIDIIQKKEADLKKIEDEIDKKIKELKKKIEETNSKRELKAQDFSEELQKLEQIKDSISKKIERELKQIVNIFDDWILDRITNLVKNNVGCSFPEKEYNLILHEGKERYEKEIPPGYKDKNKDNDNQYGDLLIWKEIIHYAKQNKKSVIFVTDEEKEDWWLIKEGKKISPRPELIREFYDETGQLFWMYTSERFSDTIKSILEISDKEALEKAIEEMKETKRKEKIYSDIQSLFGEYSVLQLSKILLEQLKKQQEQIQTLMEQSSIRLLERALRQVNQAEYWVKQLQDKYSKVSEQLLTQQQSLTEPLRKTPKPEASDNKTEQD